VEGQTSTKTDRYSDGIDLLKGLLPVEKKGFGGLVVKVQPIKSNFAQLRPQLRPLKNSLILTD
jgi:hypothetical protein